MSRNEDAPDDLPILEISDNPADLGFPDMPTPTPMREWGIRDARAFELISDELKSRNENDPVLGGRIHACMDFRWNREYQRAKIMGEEVDFNMNAFDLSDLAEGPHICHWTGGGKLRFGLVGDISDERRVEALLEALDRLAAAAERDKVVSDVRRGDNELVGKTLQ